MIDEVRKDAHPFDAHTASFDVAPADSIDVAYEGIEPYDGLKPAWPLGLIRPGMRNFKLDPAR